MSADWAVVDNETWQQLDKTGTPATRDEVNLPHGARSDGRIGDPEDPAAFVIQNDTSNRPSRRKSFIYGSRVCGFLLDERGEHFVD